MTCRNSPGLLILLLIIPASFSSGCGKTDEPARAPITAKLSALSTAQASGVDLSQVFTPPTGVHLMAAGDAASGSTTGLETLSYLFGQMQICEDLVISGSSYGAGTHCSQLYDWGRGGSPAVLTSTTYLAYASSSIDLVTEEGRNSFNSRASGKIAAGTYRYVAVNWAPYFKVKGSVAVGATTVRTQTCTIDETTGYCLSTNSLSTATENAESILRAANGGSWYRFQNPYVITQAEIDGGAEYQIDLVFNPVGAIVANKAQTPAATGGQGLLTDVNTTTAGNGIYAPLLQLTPVPRKKDQKTSKETYSITLPSSYGTARVELYFQSADAARTIYGVNVLTLLTTTSAATFTQIDTAAKIATTEISSNGKLTLKTVNGTAVITDLTRRESGTVTVQSLAGIPSSSTASYTYTGTVEL